MTDEELQAIEARHNARKEYAASLGWIMRPERMQPNEDIGLLLAEVRRLRVKLAEYEAQDEPYYEPYEPIPAPDYSHYD